jgi:hypothetical protein
MELSEIVAEIEKEARLPALAIAAHQKTLEALAELARRVERIEKARRR